MLLYVQFKYSFYRYLGRPLTKSDLTYASRRSQQGMPAREYGVHRQIPRNSVTTWRLLAIKPQKFAELGKTREFSSRKMPHIWRNSVNTGAKANYSDKVSGIEKKFL